MKIFRTITILFAIFALTASSCGKDPGQESKPALSADTAEINVGADALEATVSITANRSWRASVMDDWAAINGESRFVIDDGKDRTTVLNLTFDPNPSTDERSTSLVIRGEEFKDLVIAIVQKGKSTANTLATTSELSYGAIPYTGGSYTLDIQSNTSWTASLAEGSSENFTILDSGKSVFSFKGEGNGKCVLKVGTNPSADPVNATLTIVDNDGQCEPLVFSFSQESAPTVSIDYNATIFRPVPSFGFKRMLVFNATSSWTAVAGEGVSIDKTEGTAGTGLEIEVTVKEYTGDVDRKVKVTINGNTTAEWTQLRVPDYPVFYRVYPDMYSKDTKYRCWPFVESLVNGVFGDYTLKNINPAVSSSRLVFTFGSNEKDATTGADKGNYSYNETGFLFGSNTSGTTGGYIIIPGVPGKRVSRLEYFNGGSSDKYANRITVTDADGKIIAGGEEFKVFRNRWAEQAIADKTIAINSLQEDLQMSPDAYGCWILTGSKADEPVYMRFTARVFMRWFTVSYENAE